MRYSVGCHELVSGLVRPERAAAGPPHCTLGVEVGAVPVVFCVNGAP